MNTASNQHTPITVAVHGAAGRMGRELVALSLEQDAWQLCGAIVTENSAAQGQDIGLFHGLTPTGVAADTQIPACDVVIDFSLPPGTIALADRCAAVGAALVSGTTGLDNAAFDALRAASNNIPVLWTANTSIGVHIAAALARTAAAALPEADVEIVEIHHREKQDAPSGTALMLGEAAAAGRGELLEDLRVDGRSGDSSARCTGEIGFASIRGGTVPGEHRVMLLWNDERIEIGHAAASRRIFATGALHAARWLVTQGPGYYAMADVLA